MSTRLRDMTKDIEALSRLRYMHSKRQWDTVTEKRNMYWNRTEKSYNSFASINHAIQCMLIAWDRVLVLPMHTSRCSTWLHVPAITSQKTFQYRWLYSAYTSQIHLSSPYESIQIVLMIDSSNNMKFGVILKYFQERKIAKDIRMEFETSLLIKRLNGLVALQKFCLNDWYHNIQISRSLSKPKSRSRWCISIHPIGKNNLDFIDALWVGAAGETTAVRLRTSGPHERACANKQPNCYCEYVFHQPYGVQGKLKVRIITQHTIVN